MVRIGQIQKTACTKLYLKQKYEKIVSNYL
jgi:hypothetical protein